MSDAGSRTNRSATTRHGVPSVSRQDRDLTSRPRVHIDVAVRHQYVVMPLHQDAANRLENPFGQPAARAHEGVPVESLVTHPELPSTSRTVHLCDSSACKAGAPPSLFGRRLHAYGIVAAIALLFAVVFIPILGLCCGRPLSPPPRWIRS